MKADDRVKALAETLDQLAAVRFGLQAYLHRVAEQSDAGLAGGGTGTRTSRESDPVGGQVDDRGRRADPAVFELRGFDAELQGVVRAVGKLYDRYERVSKPRQAPAKMADPGCELCAQVPNHHCPTYVTIEVEQPARKGRPPIKRKVRLCYWCWRFSRPTRNDRLPFPEEVQAHAEGRRVMVAKSG